MSDAVRPRGRPPLPAAERRSESARVVARLTVAERAALEREAESTGMPLAELVRRGLRALGILPSVPPAA